MLFRSFLRPSQDANVAKLYSEAAPEGDLNFYRNAFVLMGGGAMKSTLADMKKYLCMYLNEGALDGGGRLASARGVRAMCRPRIPTRSQQMKDSSVVKSFPGKEDKVINRCWNKINKKSDLDTRRIRRVCRHPRRHTRDAGMDAGQEHGAFARLLPG